MTGEERNIAEHRKEVALGTLYIVIGLVAFIGPIWLTYGQRGVVILICEIVILKLGLELHEKCEQIKSLQERLDSQQEATDELWKWVCAQGAPPTTTGRFTWLP